MLWAGVGQWQPAGRCRESVITNYRGAMICKDATTRRSVQRINVVAAQALIAAAKL